MGLEQVVRVVLYLDKVLRAILYLDQVVLYRDKVLQAILRRAVIGEADDYILVYRDSVQRSGGSGSLVW